MPLQTIGCLAYVVHCKGKAHCHEHTSKALRYGTRSQGISQFYLTEWTIPAFAFPAEAGTHLPTPGGWKAELAL